MQPKKPSPSFPHTESWDDFLDFSRWRVPESTVVAKRLAENFVLYSGNYIWMWIVVTAAYALFLNWRILVSLFIIAGGWHAAGLLYRNACLLEARDGRLGSKRPEKDYSLPPSSKGWLLFFGVFVLYEFSVLLPLFLTFLGTVLIACGHALARPIQNEIYVLHQMKAQKKMALDRPSVVHSDGFQDSQEEEVVDFSNDQKYTTNLRNRSDTAKSYTS